MKTITGILILLIAASVAFGENTLTLSREIKLPIIIKGKTAGSMGIPSGSKFILIEERGQNVLVQKSGLEPVLLPRSAFSEFSETSPSIPLPLTTPAATPKPIPVSAPSPTPAETPKTIPASPSNQDPPEQPSNAPIDNSEAASTPDKPDNEVAVSDFPNPSAPLISAANEPVPPKKILIIPHSGRGGGALALWKTAKKLKEKGHTVRLLGRPPKVPEAPLETSDWILAKELKMADIDAVISGCSDHTPEKQIYEARDLGKLAVISSENGPWDLIEDKEFAKKQEAEYLQKQVSDGLLEKNSKNLNWEQAPWGGESSGSPGHSSKSKSSCIRIGDVAKCNNILAYNFSTPGGGFSDIKMSNNGYRWDFSKGWDSIEGWNEQSAEKFTSTILIPAIQEALRTTIPSQYALAPKALKTASFVPKRPTLPYTFPLARPKTEGKIVTWGDKSDSIPKPDGLRCVQVATGYSEKPHALALKKDGTVVAWGDNSKGQCNVPEGLNNVVQIAAGAEASAALREDGTIAVWGNDRITSDVSPDIKNVVQIAIEQSLLLLLADGTVVKPTRGKTKIKDVTPASEKIVQISGGFEGVGLTETGRVVFFRESNDASHYVSPSMGEVASLATCNAQAETVAVLLVDGTVRAWGRNDSGQCLVPSNLADVVQVSAGHDNIFALKKDGSVVGWGASYMRQLEFPPELKNVQQIAAGLGFFAAIVKD